jgi:23S rRNA (cytosine1962-C5)-methyltransferase
MDEPPASWSDLPRPAERRIALRVTPAAERALRQGHPWLFAEAIQSQSHAGRPGDLAVVFDGKRRFLAAGLYDPTSPLRVRLLVHGRPATVDREWYRQRLAAAVARRAPLLATDTTGYRLVHGENDGLAGLVVDRYEESLVVRLDTVAWAPHFAALLPALLEVAPAGRLVLRLSRAIRPAAAELFNLADGALLLGQPPAGPLLFRENGLIFEADVVHGQKTGFFLDQRDNRARVEELAAGRRVLNVFAYSGGFSLYAARGRAIEVDSLDLSRLALEAAARNFDHNRADPAVAAARHRLIAGDAFDEMARLAGQGRRYELVVVDPPSFARRQEEVAGSLAAYGRLATLGLALLPPGGILVMASCSSRVPAGAFFAAIRRAAGAAGRPLRELARTGHPLDHPIGFTEGAYLKCLFATAP